MLVHMCLFSSNNKKKVQMGEQEALIEILKKLWTQYLEMQGLGIWDMSFTGLF